MNTTLHNVDNAQAMWKDLANETTPMQYEIISPELYDFLIDVIAIITLVVAVVGVITNAINIKTFKLIGIEDGVTVTFFVLSVTDFIYTFNTFVQSVCGVLLMYEKQHGITLFKMDLFALMFFCMNIGATIVVVTTLTTTYLAVVRCLCVARPLQFKMMFTRFKSTVVLVSFAIIAFVAHLPLFSQMGMTTRFDPTLNDSRIVLWFSPDRQKYNAITRTIFMFLLRIFSQVILAVCVVVMATKLRKSVQFRQKNADGQTNDGVQKLSGKERSVVIQVVVICTVSTICGLANTSALLVNLAHPKVDMGKPGQYLYLLMGQYLFTFDCLNSSLNFFVYCKFNSKFRSLCYSCSTK